MKKLYAFLIVTSIASPIELSFDNPFPKTETELANQAAIKLWEKIEINSSADVILDSLLELYYRVRNIKKSIPYEDLLYILRVLNSIEDKCKDSEKIFKKILLILEAPIQA